MKLKSMIDVDVNLCKTDDKRKEGLALDQIEPKENEVIDTTLYLLEKILIKPSPRKRVIDVNAVFAKFEPSINQNSQN